MRRFAFVWMILVALAAPARADDAATLSAEAWAGDAALARAALETIHPGYDRYTPKTELDAAWDAFAAEGGGSISAFYLGLSRILAEIRCDHTKAELPPALEEALSARPTHLPFRFKVIEGRMIVDAAAEGIALSRGEEILSLDGAPVADALAWAAAFNPVDGDTDTVKGAALADTAEFLGSGFDHFWALRDDFDARVALEVAGLDGATRALAVDRVRFEDFLAIREQQRYRDFKDEVAFTPIGAEGGYLAVNTFVNYRRPVDPDAIYGPIFQQLKDEGRTKLIVDLRTNGGGSDDAMGGLMRRLADRPVRFAQEFRVATLDLSAFKGRLSTWDPSALEPDPAAFDALPDGGYRLKDGGAATRPIPPSDDAFVGDLVILVGPANASGVTHLLAGLQFSEAGAVFVGEPTGGAATGATAGVIFFLTLPESGARVRVPAVRTVTAGADVLPPRLGVTPDIAAAPTVAGFRAGRDEALETALAHLGYPANALGDGS